MLKAILCNGAIVPLEPVPVEWEEGAALEVAKMPASTPGSPAAVLAAVEAAPHVPSEWVDELEQLIASGRRPPTQIDPFPEQHGGQEAP